MKHVFYFLIVAFNPWKCHYCGIRGCSPTDYPDGTTWWKGKLCGHRYWQTARGFEETN
jgi:hypothetical protein